MPFAQLPASLAEGAHSIFKVPLFHLFHRPVSSFSDPASLCLWWWWFSHQIVSNSCDSMDCSPSFLGFSRQEYWSRWQFPFTGDLPDPGIELGSSALQVDSLLTEPHIHITPCLCCHIIEYLLCAKYRPRYISSQEGPCSYEASILVNR